MGQEFSDINGAMRRFEFLIGRQGIAVYDQAEKVGTHSWPFEASLHGT
jgi:hypothetical protein